jgi:D-sedoheptulose 7-phosphate isomerase
MRSEFERYIEVLTRSLTKIDLASLDAFGLALQRAWSSGKSVFLCGNGGSAGNAIHIANDWLYGAGVTHGGGLRVEALSSNSAILTCLGNDIGYDQIYSEQVRVKGRVGDLLIVLSGSGNSPNVVKALEMGNTIGMETFAILGFSGGLCKSTAQHSIHIEVNDMQIAEDLQLIIGHVCMKWLSATGKGLN